jgi:flagellar biosynthesis protein FlhA
VINEAEARKRREDVAQEADFYGAMDGASKFVRGDAVAGIVITLINIAGGIYVGMVEHGWPIMDVLKLYTKLTIGDGLVSQIPAFVVSLGAGLIITRSSSKRQLGDEVFGQMLAKPQALVVAAIFLVLMSVTGLPALPMIITGGCLGGLAYIMSRSQLQAKVKAEKAEIEKAANVKREPEKAEKMLELDTMELAVGYGLVKLVDTNKGGDLLDRISNIRRQLASDLGIIVPPIRIRDEMTLGANDYAIKIRGQTVARGVTYPEQFLAMDSGAVMGPLPNAEATIEPAFGLPAYWITESQKQQAEVMYYTVVEASAVLATHLTECIRSHASELLSRQDVKNLLENLKARVPALVEEVVPGQVKPGELQKVMQNLLRERVPVRDLETILETLSDYSARTKDLDVLTEYTRNALARTICKQHVDPEDKLYCITLDPALEDLINGHIQRSEAGVNNSMPPQTQQQVVQRIAAKVQEQTSMGRQPILLCVPLIRSTLRRLIEGTLPQTAVLGMNEIVPEVGVEAVAMVGVNG